MQADTGSDSSGNDSGDAAGMDGTADTSADGGGCNNDTCGTAITLTSGMTQSCTTMGMVDDYDFGATPSQACTADFGGNKYDGPDVAFKIDVLPGKTLTVVATPTANWDLALGFVSNCAMADTSCVAAADANPAGQAETATWTNNSNVPETIFVIVDAPSPDQGPFTLLPTVL